MKLWAPFHRDCHIGLTNGTTFLVPSDKAGIEVPAAFCRAAIASGCIPVGTEPHVPERDTFSRATAMHPEPKTAAAAKRAHGGLMSQLEQPRDTVVHSEGPGLADVTTKPAAKHKTSGATCGNAIADAIMRRLQQAGEAGLSRTAIRDAFGRNVRGIGAALDRLHREGKATCERMNAGRAGGRPPEVWTAVQ